MKSFFVLLFAAQAHGSALSLGTSALYNLQKTMLSEVWGHLYRLWRAETD